MLMQIPQPGCRELLQDDPALSHPLQVPAWHCSSIYLLQRLNRENTPSDGICNTAYPFCGNCFRTPKDGVLKILINRLSYILILNNSVKIFVGHGNSTAYKIYVFCKVRIQSSSTISSYVITPSILKWHLMEYEIFDSIYTEELNKLIWCRLHFLWIYHFPSP